jgi:hypothetical protein
MSRKLACCLILCLAFSAYSEGGDLALKEKSLGILAEHLATAKTPAEMDDLTNAAVEQRIELMGQLAGLLRSSASSELKTRACFLLGFYRAERAIDELVDNIDLEVDVTGEQSKIRQWGRFPCAEALAYIGAPAQEKLVRLLASSDEKVARQQALEALTFIHKKDVVTVLQEALGRLQGEEARRVREAIGEIKKQLGQKP